MEIGSTLTRDASTRDRVARAVLERGPVTAADLAAELGLTPAAVRRHLDALLEEGLAEARDLHPMVARRGRPPRGYVLTDAGHASMATAYDDLAASALRFLATEAGPAAVERFATERVAELERRYLPVVEAAGPDVESRAEALAGALSSDGYAASTRPVPGASGHIGTQLCQGHCPVQHVASEFPELCEAETEVFARLLGVHVQRLATLARGAHVCTTHIPTDHLATQHVPTDHSTAESPDGRTSR